MGPDGSLIRLRSRTWFFDRLREVPVRLVRHWKQIAVKQGLLPLDEYVAMATSLTDAQLGSLDQAIDQADLPFGSVEASAVDFTRHSLRLYASLSPGQRQALWRGRAIPFAEMTPPERALFLVGLKEQVRRQYQPIPVDLSHLADGSFALSTQPMVRTILNQGGSVYLQPVGEAGGKGRPLPDEFGKPVNAAPARVDRVTFQFDYGDGERETYELMVAPLP
jgi:hypothetical protein